MQTKWDRRETKKFNAHKMKVNGASVRLLHRIITERAEQARKELRMEKNICLTH